MFDCVNPVSKDAFEAGIWTLCSTQGFLSIVGPGVGKCLPMERKPFSMCICTLSLPNLPTKAAPAKALRSTVDLRTSGSWTRW